MKTIEVYFTVHEPTSMAASLRIPSLGLTVASRAEAEMKPSLGLPFRAYCDQVMLDGLFSPTVTEPHAHGPYVDVDLSPTSVAVLLSLVRRQRWSIECGSMEWRQRWFDPSPILAADVDPPAVPHEHWEHVLARYVRDQRAAVASSSAPGTMEFDGLMDGLRILELHVGRSVGDIAYCVLRRKRAEKGMMLEDRSCAEVRRHMYATQQVFSGGEIALAAVGGEAVSDRARLRCAELVEAIEKEGKQV